MAVLFAFTALLAVANANFFWGSCPEPPVPTELVTNIWMGQWFEMARTSSVPYSTTNDCNAVNYTLTDGKVDASRCTYDASTATYQCDQGKITCDNGNEGFCT